MTDNAVVRKSGLLDVLREQRYPEGAEVLADRGFNGLDHFLYRDLFSAPLVIRLPIETKVGNVALIFEFDVERGHLYPVVDANNSNDNDNESTRSRTPNNKRSELSTIALRRRRSRWQHILCSNCSLP